MKKRYNSNEDISKSKYILPQKQRTQRRSGSGGITRDNVWGERIGIRWSWGPINPFSVLNGCKTRAGGRGCGPGSILVCLMG